MDRQDHALQGSKGLRRAKDSLKQAIIPPDLAVRSSTAEKIPDLRDDLPILTTTDLQHWSIDKEATYHDSSRRNTAPGGLIAREDDNLIEGSVAFRSESAPDAGIRPLRNSWTSTTLEKSKLAMPSGKLIQAAFSPTGLTLVLLSDKQVILHPLDGKARTAATSSNCRYLLVKTLGDLGMARSTRQLRSASVTDQFVLFRGVGQVLLYQIYFETNDKMPRGSEWKLLDTSDCPVNKLCRATVSHHGNMLLQFDAYLLFWRRAGPGNSRTERLEVDGRIEVASISPDGLFISAWTIGANHSWYIWSIDSDSAVLVGSGAHKSLIGKPLEELIPLASMPAFVVRRGQGLVHIIHNNASAVNQEEITRRLSSILAGLHVPEAGKLLLFQRKQIFLLQITGGLGTTIRFQGETEICTLSKQITIDESSVITAQMGFNNWTVRLLIFGPSKGLLEEVIIHKPAD